MTLLIISLFLAIVIFLLTVKLKEYVEEVAQLRKQIEETAAAHIIEKAKVKKDSTFRSSAVNWGNSVENFVPFMTNFPIPPEDVNFLGKPIDYVGFTNTESVDNCEVHFIEVKSGKSFLSQKQKNIKKAIREGRVKWHEVRVNANTIVEEL